MTSHLKCTRLPLQLIRYEQVDDQAGATSAGYMDVPAENGGGGGTPKNENQARPGAEWDADSEAFYEPPSLARHGPTPGDTPYGVVINAGL